MTVPRARGEARDRLYLAALLAALVVSLALYGGLAILLGSPPPGWNGWAGFSIPSAAMFRAFTGLPHAALSPAGWEVAVASDLGLLWASLGGAVLLQRAVVSEAARRRARCIVIGGGLAMLALVVVFVPPLLTSDLYRQAIYGRMVRRGLNPYATFASASGDPLLAFATETTTTTIYGPAYTWLSALTSVLAPPGVLGVVLGWKTISALAAAGCFALAAPLARALAGPGREAHADEARLWLAWNPLLVLESAGMAHIESIMMLSALAGLLLWQRRQPARGAALLTLSALTKWVTGVLLVLATLREIRAAPRAQRRSLTLRLLGVVATVTAVLYLPFARGFATASGIHTLAVNGGGGIGAPPPAGLPQWARMIGFAATTAMAAFLVTAKDGARVVAASTVLMLLFVLVVVPWFFPWYLLGPIVLAVVLPPGPQGRWLRVASLGLAAGVMLYYANLVPLP